MKLMISVALLAVICQTAESIKSKDSEMSIKRELQEGVFGLKINPLIVKAEESEDKATNLRDNNDRRNDSQTELPEKANASRNEPVAKISDILSGRDVTFPAAIQSHLHSPVQIYQPRLGSFEISPPIPSQLAYAEHKMFQMNENMNENLRVLNQNLQQLQPFREPFSINPFVAITPPTPQTPPDFLFRLKNHKLPPLTSWSPQIYQQLFPSIPGVDPRDIYHEINQLQLPYEEIVQLNLDDEESNDVEPKEKQQWIINVGSINENQNTLEIENTSQAHTQTNQNSTTSTKPLAVSYVRFYQKLPNSQGQMTEQVTLESLTIPPRDQLLPLDQSPPVFQSIQVNPPASSVTTTTLAPHRIGVIRIRQQDTTPASQSGDPQTLSTSFLPTTSQSPILMKEPFNSNIPLQSGPTLRPLPAAPLNNVQASAVKTQNSFPTRPTIPPLPLLTRRPLQNLSPLPLFSFKMPNSPQLLSLPTLFPPTVQFIQSTVSPSPLGSTQSISASSEGLPTLQLLQGLPTPPPLPPLQTELSKTTVSPYKPGNNSQPATPTSFDQENKPIDIDQQQKLPLQPQPIQFAHQEQTLIHTPQSHKLLQIVDKPEINLEQTISLANQLSPLDQQSQKALQELNGSQPQLKPPTQTETQNKTAQQKLENEDHSLQQTSKNPSQVPQPNLYSELFPNSLYSGDQYYFQPSFLPVPVGFPSFSNAFIPYASQNVLYGNLPTPVIPPYVPSFHNNGPTAVSALQYYQNYAPDVFGNWR